MQDVTRTIGLLVRPFGYFFPPATDLEADAIAAPAARMLAKAPLVQMVIRKVADPVVLVGATVALFAGRQLGPRATPRAAPVPPAPHAQTHTQSTPAAAQPAAPFVPTLDPAIVAAAAALEHARVAELREQILNGIAHADMR